MTLYSLFFALNSWAIRAKKQNIYGQNLKPESVLLFQHRSLAKKRLETLPLPQTGKRCKCPPNLFFSPFILSDNVFYRNEIWIGLLFGLLLPICTFVMLYELFNLLEVRGAASGTGLSSNFRERTVAILAISLNLLPLNIYRNRRWDRSMRGVVIATAILALVWVFRYGINLF